jgi:glutaminyl-peptide cyclotransferase
MKKSLLILLSLVVIISSCDKSSKSEQSTTTEAVKLAPAPAFNADSAYFFTEKQVQFGPRVPNTPAHVKCGDWMMATLKKYGFEAIEQKFNATTFDGKNLNARNIIGTFNPSAPKRILLAAHWDARPFADKDSVNKNGAIDAANDGASGVAVLLEVARVINETKNKPNVGVDIIFFDAEDWGEREDMQASTDKVFWCLGSQHWAKNPHKEGYSAYFGILLDMVGAKGATFPKEAYSKQYAGSITDNIWNIAGQLGYSQYFMQADGGGITDDHVFVNTIAKIPMVDILHQQLNSNKTFFDHHHTHGDTMDKIDRGTLKAVGQTLVQVLYQESVAVQ